VPWKQAAKPARQEAAELSAGHQQFPTRVGPMTSPNIKLKGVIRHRLS